MLNTLDEQLKILIVDDDAVDRMALKRALKSTDFTVTISEAGDADSALSQITAGQYSCIFLDYNLPGKNGLEITNQIRNQGIRVPILVLTGQGNEQTAVELMKAGASDYLPKSKLSTDTIARLIRSAISMHRAEEIVATANKNLREKNRLLEKKNKELARQRRYIHQQNLQLQEVSRLKSEFLATMSHELRTPLNAIIGFSQILLGKAKGTLSPVQTDMMSRVLANGRNLLELINDILSFSKLEAGRLALEPASFNIAELATTTAEELQSLAAQKSLDIDIDIDIDNPVVINDRVRIRQILVNLLSNAIKFTSQGSVKIQLREISATAASEPKERSPKKEREKSTDSIQLSVIDTGCGISEADQLYIFDPFHQADQKVTRKHAGTGLGLAITYSLVKMMHGNISVSSILEEGTSFTIELPRKIVIDEESLSLCSLTYNGADDTDSEE